MGHVLAENADKNIKTGYPCFEGSCGDRGIPGIFKRWLRNLKYAYQRIMYGYCDRDVFEIHSWFLKVVPGMLKELKKHSDNVPSSVYMELGGDPVGWDEEIMKKAAEKWNSILNEMICLFEEADEENEKYLGLNSADELLKAEEHRDECLKSGMNLFTKWFRDLWW